MEWLLIALAAGGGGFFVRKVRARASRRQEAATDLEGVRRLADEDVTFLGEQLQRLDGEVAGAELDEATKVYYQTALDSYETAQRAVPRLRSPEEVSTVTDTLAAGRYALACVQATVAGRPLPELRVPCFFNPQHGPSAGNVMWTPPGRGTRSVPACAQDAARIAEHEAPEVRTVKVGARTVPYWQAGAAFLPYGEGYFPSAGLLTWAFQTPANSAINGHVGGAIWGGGHDGPGMEGAGMDGGGGD